jgi:hypothetical protein
MWSHEKPRVRSLTIKLFSGTYHSEYLPEILPRISPDIRKTSNFCYPVAEEVHHWFYRQNLFIIAVLQQYTVEKESNWKQHDGGQQ